MPRNECQSQVKSRLQNRLLKAREILISDPVDSGLAGDVIASLRVLELESPDEPVNIFINSPGGAIDDGFAIYDTMRAVKCPIRTICTGLAASMATILLLGGDRGQRFVMPNCRAMIHQPRGGAGGQASDIAITAEAILKLRARINAIISEETGQALEQVEKDMDRDRWMSAEEAVEYGLFDKIIGSFEDLSGK
jgi:ATP-dependent Clp protease, protease subunit